MNNDVSHLAFCMYVSYEFVYEATSEFVAILRRYVNDDTRIIDITPRDHYRKVWGELPNAHIIISYNALDAEFLFGNLRKQRMLCDQMILSDGLCVAAVCKSKCKYEGRLDARVKRHGNKLISDSISEGQIYCVLAQQYAKTKSFAEIMKMGENIMSKITKVRFAYEFLNMRNKYEDDDYVYKYEYSMIEFKEVLPAYTSVV